MTKEGLLEIPPTLMAVRNYSNMLINSLLHFANVLPFYGETEASIAYEESRERDAHIRRWEGIWRGYGPITRLYSWEKSLDYRRNINE